MSSSRKKVSPARVQRADACEWIGALMTPPFFVEDRDEPVRPGIVVWMELPSQVVVGHEVVAPEDVAGAVGRVLGAALAKPLFGPPRRPDRLRVPDAALTDEVRATIGDSIPVTVAPTPELDALMALMLEKMHEPREHGGYLEGGRLPPAAIADLFSAAEVLFRVAPWKSATDDQCLRMDIPALGVEGACVSIIGALGESFGVLVFPSLDGYHAFLRAADEPRLPGARPDAGTDWLALSFERGVDLPLTHRREAAKHDWPVAGANAYPVVTRHERDGALQPLVERDVKIASVCARSLAAFFAKHRAAFESDEFEPICASWIGGDDIEVRFTIPYEALDMFEIEPTKKTGRSQQPPKLRRNDPCHCGSGRKYKHCHLSVDEAENTARNAGRLLHDLDRRLVDDLVVYASRCFGETWWEFEEYFADPEESASLSIVWAVYHYRVDGTTVTERYMEDKKQRLSNEERAWLNAQCASWLSVWEVLEVEPGRSLALRDLLSGEERRVDETTASQTLVARDAILARVVDHAGISILSGVHPQGLPPRESNQVTQLLRARLPGRGPASPADLRNDTTGDNLIRLWEDAVGALSERPALPAELHNTDGDPFLLTTDHFDIAPGAASAVEAQIATIPDTEPPEPDEDPPMYVFKRPGNATHPHWPNTIVGHARVSGKTLRIETNSIKRADALRAQIEAACGDSVRHRLREHADPLSEKAARGERARSPEPVPAEAARVVQEFMKRHYTEWPDLPVPALRGKTPRQAVKTKKGRAEVDLLLKEFENSEQRRTDGPPFDFSWLRRELHLDEPRT